jgi:hypothetical protein
MPEFIPRRGMLSSLFLELLHPPLAVPVRYPAWEGNPESGRSQTSGSTSINDIGDRRRSDAKTDPRRDHVVTASTTLYECITG